LTVPVLAHRGKQHSTWPSYSAAGPKGSIAIEQAIDTYGPERLEQDVMRVYDEIRAIISYQEKKLAALLGLLGG
jgi:hypothetical protein